MIGALALGWSACDRAPAAADEAPVAGAAVLVGCATLSGDACTRPPPGEPTHCEPVRRPAGQPEAPEGAFVLTVWLPDARAADELRVDDASAPVRGTELDGGRRFEAVITPRARAITLVRSEEVVARWRLVDPRPEAELIARARPVRTYAPGDPRRAELLRELNATLPTLDDDDRAAGRDIVADLRFQHAGAVDPSDRIAAWRDAMTATTEAWEDARARGDEARARCHARRGLFAALEHLGEPELIERWHGRLLPTREPEASGAPADAYYRGLLAQRIGDLQDAVLEYGAAERGAAHTGDRLLATAAAQQLAAVLAALGREHDVATVLVRAETSVEDADCRAWLRLLNNAAWSRVRLIDLGRHADDPIPDLANALAILERSGGIEDACHDDVLEEHVRLNLALAAATAGYDGWAEDLRAALPPVHAATKGTASWRAELDRRLALNGGDRAALVEWLVSHATPPPGATTEEVWWWAFGRGEVLESLGDLDGALAAYDEAERALSSMVAALDFDAGRDHLMLGHQRSASRRVVLSIARGEPLRALCSARRTRTRTSRVLDRAARIGALPPADRRAWRSTITRYEQILHELETQRGATWSIPLDHRTDHDAGIDRLAASLSDTARQAARILAGGSGGRQGARPPDDDACPDLPTLDPGELGLLFFPLTAENAWIGFSFDASGAIATARVSTPVVGDAAGLGAALLAPFRREIDAATSLRIFASGEAWAIPFGALAWDDDVLLAKLPVRLGLDLERRDDPASARGLPETHAAIVIGDPHGDLPAAAGEAEAVEAMLEARHWSVELLVQEHARGARVRASLPRVDLLHYAGHGHHAGLEGWRSALELASGERLDVTDVLALPSVPSQVVLPACETAPTGSATLGGDMNIARAFLLAGADVVIGARERIDDRLAARMAVELYERASLEPHTAGARLRDALLTVRTDASLPPDVRAQWSGIVAVTR